jgi:aminoglycoside N3'-acetyltransferase
MATEQEAIVQCTEPRTRETLAHDLRELGMIAGVVDGQREWVTYRDIVFHEERFAGFGRLFEQECVVTLSYVGSAQSRLFSLQHVVEFAVTQVELVREEAEPK